ncbi:MAG: hypothetical protein AB7O98_14505 [Hyphomonadaceae bacterium]
MRILIAALGLFAAACGPMTISTGGGADSEADNPAGGYVMEVRAVEGAHTYIVTAPDGRVVAARAAEGVSALMSEEATGRLGVAEALNAEPPPEVVSIRVPGFSMSIAADDENPNSESARVMINADGRNIAIDADEGGMGDGDDRANVRITGASESDVRGFIADAEQLSAETRAEMLGALGLE